MWRPTSPGWPRRCAARPKAAGLRRAPAPRVLRPGREGRPPCLAHRPPAAERPPPCAPRIRADPRPCRDRPAALDDFRQEPGCRQAARREYEYAQTLLADGQLGQYLGCPEQSSRWPQARAELSAIASRARNRESKAAAAERATLSLADRFQTVLEDGRKIASALSPAAYEEVRQSA